MHLNSISFYSSIIHVTSKLAMSYYYYYIPDSSLYSYRLNSVHERFNPFQTKLILA
jgi:hypothetical protein